MLELSLNMYCSCFIVALKINLVVVYDGKVAVLPDFDQITS